MSAANPTPVPSLQSEAALTVFGEAITANPEGVVGMLRGTERGEKLIAAILADACDNNPDMLDGFFNRTPAGSRALFKMAANMQRGAISRDLMTKPLLDQDVVRVVECVDGVEEITMGTLTVSKMPLIVQELIACVLKDEGKKMCFKADEDGEGQGAGMSHYCGDGCVDRCYDGSIAITPEGMFDRSFDDYLADKYGQNKGGAEEISEMSGVGYDPDDFGNDDDDDDPDISDFLSAVIEKAEEELRTILEDLHEEVRKERTAPWFKKCIKLKNPPPLTMVWSAAAATSTDAAGAAATSSRTAAAPKKRQLPFDREDHGKKMRTKEFDMHELPVFERRPVLTILYDSNGW